MGLKKVTGVFLAVLILCSNIGLAFNVHYCGDEIASITSVYGADDSTTQKASEQKSCCAEKAKENKSCCKDKLVKLKGKSDVVVKTFSFAIDAPFVIQNWNPTVFTPISVSGKTLPITYYCDANAPPLFKLYSQFLLYA